MLKEIKGYLFVFISAILYGSYGVWAVLLGEEFGVFYQGWVRAFLVLSIILPLLFLPKIGNQLSGLILSISSGHLVSFSSLKHPFIMHFKMLV